MGSSTELPIRHLRAILTLPGVVALLVPAVLLDVTDSMNVGWGLTPGWNLLPPFVSVGFMVAGITLMTKTIRLFDRVGYGTLAPWDPTEQLVVVGVYRHVRNPMISGVLTLLLGEAGFFGSTPLLGWFAFFFLANAIYIPGSEERGLERRFGGAYRQYCANVPRWIPRFTAWESGESPPESSGVQ